MCCKSIRNLRQWAASAMLGLAAFTGSALAADNEQIRVGLTPFQDMLSVQLGFDQGFYKQAGVDLKISNIPYETAIEALAAGQVDITGTCDANMFAAWDSFPKQRMVNVFYTFEGSALMVRANAGIKSYATLFAELGDRDKALKATVAQLKGKTVISTKGTDMEMGVVATMLVGGLNMSDIKFLDMNPDDGLAAFLSGSGDAFLGGLPQRFRLVKEGYETLINAHEIGPEAVIQCGFVANADYLKNHMDALIKFARGTYLTQQYVVSNQNVAFGKIASMLNSMTGAKMTVQDLQNLWNKIEFFPATGAEAQWEVLDKNGEYYWKTRFDFVKKYYKSAGLLKSDVNVDEMYAFKDVLAEYLKKYEPDAWAAIQDQPH
jgi:NitT/TauT family transport system substrate-binding protein